jgi:hypothetical protein
MASRGSRRCCSFHTNLLQVVRLSIGFECGLSVGLERWAPVLMWWARQVPMRRAKGVARRMAGEHPEDLRLVRFLNLYSPPIDQPLVLARTAGALCTGCQNRINAIAC